MSILDRYSAHADAFESEARKNMEQCMAAHGSLLQGS